MKLGLWQPTDVNVCYSDYGSPMAGSVLCMVLLLHRQGLEQKVLSVCLGRHSSSALQAKTPALSAVSCLLDHHHQMNL